jgi:hypothetical protein
VQIRRTIAPAPGGNYLRKIAVKNGAKITISPMSYVVQKHSLAARLFLGTVKGKRIASTVAQMRKYHASMSTGLRQERKALQIIRSI